jgi:UDP-hydrolysing UDP-N-acetyl-D-glucosamine 2-epimerase
MKKICMPIFNRATYARVKSVLFAIEKSKDLECTVVLSSSILWGEYVSESHYIERDHPKIKFIKLFVDQQLTNYAGSCEIVSRFISLFSKHLYDNTYDCVFVIGDRFETIGAATVAAIFHIPIVHLQGGEITGNIDEKIRHAVTKLSDYHFASTTLAKNYICEMGELPARVHKTGCPTADLMRFYSIRRLLNRVKDKYILCIFHPETRNINEAQAQTKAVLEAVIDYCAKYGHCCYWYWPNVDPGRHEISELLTWAHAEYKAYLVAAANTEPADFLRKLASCRLIIGNSSCGIREGSFLGVPAVNIGDRQSIRERAWNVYDVKEYDKDKIFTAMEYQHVAMKYPVSDLYGGYDVATNIVNILELAQFSIKGPLTYPYKAVFRDQHFGSVYLKRGKEHGAEPSSITRHQNRS